MPRHPLDMFRLVLFGLAAGSLAAPARAAGPLVSVLTQHNDNFRDGVNAGETILTPANVNTTQFGMLFKVAVDDQVFAQPLVVAQIGIKGATRSVLYVATAANSIYAFDADSGALYWHVNLGPPMSMAIAHWGCQDTLGSAGIMSTPVIANGALYVVAQTVQGGVSTHSLHAINLATGAELPHSPATISSPDFNSYDALQRPALLSANGRIYFSFASHCDQGSWKGLTFAYDATSLAQVGVFDAAPSDNGNGIWQSGNGAAADPAGNVYWVTGNGSWDGATNFSETMLKASPALSLQDWYTPSDYQNLDTYDADLTASGPLLLLGTSRLIGGGKDGNLRMVDTTDMGHLGDAAAQVWQATPSHIHSLVYYNAHLYVWGQSDYLRVFAFNGSSFATAPSYTGPLQAIGHPGASLSLSADGQANGILWAATNAQGQSGGLGAWHMTEPGILYAYNLANMAQIWSNEQNPARDDCGNYAKFTAPTIANGRVYLPSFGTAQTQSGQVCVYGLLQTPPAAASGALRNGIYIVTSANSGQALDDPASSRLAGTTIQQYPVNNGLNQQWVVRNLGRGVVTLVNRASGQALEVAHGSAAPSAAVDQDPFQGGLWQQWTATPLAGGAFELTSLADGQALDVTGGSTAATALIDQYPYHGVAWQQWVFTPAK